MWLKCWSNHITANGPDAAIRDIVSCMLQQLTESGSVFQQTSFDPSQFPLL